MNMPPHPYFRQLACIALLIQILLGSLVPAKVISDERSPPQETVFATSVPVPPKAPKHARLRVYREPPVSGKDHLEALQLPPRPLAPEVPIAGTGDAGPLWPATEVRPRRQFRGRGFCQPPRCCWRIQVCYQLGKQPRSHRSRSRASFHQE